jgi:hypothetical protein
MLLRSVRCRATAAALGLLTGCSWVFVQKPPQGPMQPASPLACTSNVVVPVADTVGAVLLGVSGGMVAVAGLGMTQACEPQVRGSPSGARRHDGTGFAVMDGATVRLAEAQRTVTLKTCSFFTARMAAISAVARASAPAPRDEVLICGAPGEVERRGGDGALHPAPRGVR